ncbi:MAG: hypothetical protein PHH54_06795 [Candidatus Nanoarchaeia archaeon]|nr:hypothetical protein [Candidatus Nanoarchaeia archaeon]MDD5741663.1 hypothetical protein [Candidatus Nanoarchaeia archaeon]
MARKIKRTKSRKSKPSFKKELKGIEKSFEKQIDKDVKEAEKWMIQRRKFLIKLAWVLGGITVLLILSHMYLRIAGVG